MQDTRPPGERFLGLSRGDEMTPSSAFFGVFKRADAELSPFSGLGALDLLDLEGVTGGVMK